MPELEPGSIWDDDNQPLISSFYQRPVIPAGITLIGHKSQSDRERLWQEVELLLMEAEHVDMFGDEDAEDSQSRRYFLILFAPKYNNINTTAGFCQPRGGKAYAILPRGERWPYFGGLASGKMEGIFAFRANTNVCFRPQTFLH